VYLVTLSLASSPDRVIMAESTTSPTISPSQAQYPSAISSDNTILITRATSALGIATIEELVNLSRQESGSLRLKIRAATQEKSKDKLKELKNRFDAIETVVLNYQDPASLSSALRGVDTIFFIPSDSLDRLQQSKALIDAARLTRVSHFIDVGFSLSDTSSLSLACWQRMLEVYVEQAGFEQYAHLHCAPLLEELFVMHGCSMLHGQQLFTIFRAESQVNWVTIKSVALVAARLLAMPHKINVDQRALTLCSERATVSSILETISKSLGKMIHPVTVSCDDYARLVPNMEPLWRHALLEYLSLYNREGWQDQSILCQPEPSLIHAVTHQTIPSIFDQVAKMAVATGGQDQTGAALGQVHVE